MARKHLFYRIMSVILTLALVTGVMPATMAMGSEAVDMEQIEEVLQEIPNDNVMPSDSEMGKEALDMGADGEKSDTSAEDPLISELTDDVTTTNDSAIEADVTEPLQEDTSVMPTAADMVYASGMTDGYGSNGKFLAPIESPSGTIPVSSPEDLMAIKNNLAGSYYLTKDIDLSGIEWAPIGTYEAPFRGVFDGQGHVIKNLTIQNEDNYVLNSEINGVDYHDYSLFGVLLYSSINNLALENVKIDLDLQYYNPLMYVYVNPIGTPRFQTEPRVSMNNCYTTGTIKIDVNAISPEGFDIFACGMIASQITDCYNMTDVIVDVSCTSVDDEPMQIAHATAVGMSSDGSIERCYNAGNISSAVNAAGNFGVTWDRAAEAYGLSAGMVKNSYNTGNISTDVSAVDTVGRNGTDFYSYYTSNARGIYGRSMSSGIDCTYNIGNISAHASNNDTIDMQNRPSIASAIGIWTNRGGSNSASRTDGLSSSDQSAAFGSVTLERLTNCIEIDSSDSYSQSFWQDTLSFDFDTVWRMSDVGDYPIFKVQAESEDDGGDDKDTETKTVAIEYNPEYDDGKVSVKWGAELFSNPSVFTYNEELALVAAALNGAAGSGGAERGYYIEKAYRDLGFAEENIYLFSYPGHPKNQNDFGAINPNDEDFAFSIAHQTMVINGEETNVVAIVLRGTETAAEGLGDLVANDVITEPFYGYSVHNYFLSYMKDVWIGLQYYANQHNGEYTNGNFGTSASDELAIRGNIKAGKTKFLIAGHSLGGAAANLLAAKMSLILEHGSNDWLNEGWDFAPATNDIYAFTFGALNTFDHFDDTAKNYTNITNFFNYYDTFGPQGEGWEGTGAKPASGWISREYKFGNIENYNISYHGLFGKGQHVYKNHAMPCYINAIECDFDPYQALDSFKSDENPDGYYDYVFPNFQTHYAIRKAKLYTEPDENSASSAELVVGDKVEAIAATYGLDDKYWYKTADGWIYSGNLSPLNPMTSLDSSSLKQITVKCPVDIEVYDVSGNLMASIINHVATGYSDHVYPEVIGSIKQIFISGDQAYIVNLLAKDLGFMSYSVRQYKSNTNGMEEMKSFEEVLLTPDKVMVSELGGTIEVPEVQLFVLGEQSNLTAEVQTDGTETPIVSSAAYTVTFMNGNTVYTTKTITTPATTIDTLPVNPTNGNYTFSGWYTEENGGGTRIYASTPISSNMTVYAHWTGNSFNGGTSNGGGGGGSSYTNASISKASASFDKNNSADIVIALNKGSYTLTAVKNASYTLKQGTDYTISGNVVTIKKEYLATLESGEHTLTFDMSGGTDPKLTITITDTAEPEPDTDTVTPEPITPAMPVNPFTDVTGADWFADDVIYVYEKSLMSGTSTSPMLFSPNMAATRGMIVTILYRHAGAPDVRGLENTFDDVEAGQWYADAVKWAADNDIVSGVGNGSYAPDAPITRQDFAIILMNYMDFLGINLPVTEQYIIFSDEMDIADYAKNAIQTLNKLGVINGVGNNTISPKGNATRAQVAAMLHSFMELAANK